MSRYITPVRILDDDDLGSSSSSEDQWLNFAAASDPDPLPFADTPLAPALEREVVEVELNSLSSSEEDEVRSWSCRGCANKTDDHTGFGGCLDPCPGCRATIRFVPEKKHAHTRYNGCCSACPSCRAGSGSHRGKDGCNESCPACKAGTDDHTGRDGCQETCPGCFTGTELESTTHKGKNGCQEKCHGCKAGEGGSHNYDGGGCENPCNACRCDLPMDNDAHKYEPYSCRSRCPGCIALDAIEAPSHSKGPGACQSTCYGCRHSRSGQHEHMDTGGCLAPQEEEEEEAYYDPRPVAYPVYGLIPENLSTVEVTATFRNGRESLCTQAQPTAATLTTLALFNGISQTQAEHPADSTKEAIHLSFGYNSEQIPAGVCDLRATAGVINTLLNHLRSPSTTILYGALPERFEPEHSEQELVDQFFDICTDPTCPTCDGLLSDWGDECAHCKEEEQKKKRKREAKKEAKKKKKRRASGREPYEVEFTIYVDGVKSHTDVQWMKINVNTTRFQKITRALYRLSIDSLSRSPSDFDLDQCDILYSYNDEQLLPEDTDTFRDVDIRRGIVNAAVYLTTKDEDE